MSKHTPGPWNMTADGGGFYVEGGDLLVAWAQEVDPCPSGAEDYFPGDTTEANARLIAAAPELLEALELLTAGIENSVSDTYIPLVKARAAIAKATGEKA